MLGVNPLANHSTYQCVYHGWLCFAELEMEGKHVSAFLHQLLDVVTGKEPRLWSCPQAAATESYNRDTTVSLEPSHANSPPLKGALDE